MRKEPDIDLSPTAPDDVKFTTCYMCACRCGIKVHLRDGQVPPYRRQSQSSGQQGRAVRQGLVRIMQHYSPARLRKPLKRVGERGKGEFVEIEWDEALAIATRLAVGHPRAAIPKKLAFFTGRDQSQSLTGWWAAQFGTPNFAAHGGFCSVNMAAAGLYTIGGSFWEFGEPDWDRAKYFMLFGVAEDHDSNPIKAGLAKLKARGAKIVSVNPIRTGYSAIADEWIGIRPGTDGLFVLALVHELLHADNDRSRLSRPLRQRALAGHPGARARPITACSRATRTANRWPGTRAKRRLVNAMSADVAPAVVGEFTLADGRKAVPVFQLVAERYMDERYSPDAVAATCGVSADAIRRIAAELAEIAFEQTIELDVEWTDWAGRKHDKIVGRPVAIHAMRGVSAHTNGFHTCRAIHLLQALLGAIDCPGGFRFKAPFPQADSAGAKARRQERRRADDAAQRHAARLPTGPEDLLVEPDGTPIRIDKAFSWEAPLATHGMMHMVIANAWRGDPYPIDTLFMYMANMAWNSSMNTAARHRHAHRQGRRRPLQDPALHLFGRLCVRDGRLRRSRAARHDLSRALGLHLDAGSRDRLGRRAGATPSASRSSRPTATCALSRRCCSISARGSGCRGMTNDGRRRRNIPAAIPTTSSITSARPASGRSPAGAAKRARITGAARSIQTSSKPMSTTSASGITSSRRTRSSTNSPTRLISNSPRDMGFVARRASRSSSSSIPSRCRSSAWRRRATAPIQPPDDLRARVKAAFDPLPIWYAPLEEERVDRTAYPLHALTQRPMIMYHSWGSQNAWLRQILGRNRLYVATATARELGLADGDWVRVVQPQRRDQGPDQDDGRRQSRHGLDLERHRQAIGRLDARAGCAGSAQGISAQSSDQRTAARRSRRSPTARIPIRSRVRRRGSICACGSKNASAGDETTQPQFADTAATAGLAGAAAHRRGARSPVELGEAAGQSS